MTRCVAGSLILDWSLSINIQCFG